MAAGATASYTYIARMPAINQDGSRGSSFLRKTTLPSEFMAGMCTWHSQKRERMPLIVYLGNTLAEAPQKTHKGSLVIRWLSLISCFQLWAFLLAILGFIMCFTSTVSVQWRVWHIQNGTGFSSAIVWIGIWRVCTIQLATAAEKSSLSCLEFNELYSSLSKEILIARDLMALASIVNALAISSMSFALYNVFKPISQKTFIVTFFYIGAGLDLTSGIFVLISVSWNMHCVLLEEGIQFPGFFRLPPIPKRQYVGAAIYVGFVAAAFQLLSGSLVLIETCLLKFSKSHLSKTVVIHESAIARKSESQTTCPKCGSVSTMDLAIQNQSSPYRSFADHMNVSKTSAESAQTTLGPIPTRPVIFVTPCSSKKIIGF
ncbi:claudin-34-like [Rhineura floridana]|uniref:claudin-34-like n=1 Tax=Rhineura floridana TaxID=261503 RepID=UPI002AC7ED0E|nr:claudin-34-like [Rhineura floridana]